MNAADLGLPETAIVITASRLPGGEPVPASSLFDSAMLDHLGAPVVVEYLRLSPSTAISTSGPTGSLTEVRIRGAEANHTLLFIDGIRANDPAAGNAPRFELLNADIAGRLAVVRGPQSALWGSEAIGGVVTVDGASPVRTGLRAALEGGSFATRRGSVTGNWVAGAFTGSLALAHQRSDGIDSFDGSGDRDGFRNTALRGIIGWRIAPQLKLIANGFYLKGRSQYDGLDPVFYVRADTLDETRNTLGAGRVAVEMGSADSDWSGHVSASLLASRNDNNLAGADLNWTSGRRFSLEGQLNRRFATGKIVHRLALVAAHESEQFKADDVSFGGFTRQDRSRQHQSVTAEWRAEYGKIVTTDIAVRQDKFNRFKDATSLRASLAVRPLEPLTLAIAYAEGIAQPSFFDLYGFFPGSFAGNPALKTERSKGWEASVRYASDSWSVEATYFRQRLADEIIDTYDSGTFTSSTANSDGRSKREGVELEAAWRPAQWLRLAANYSWLDADQPAVAGPVREARRPRHSGSVTADGSAGKFNYGLSVAHVGKRRDTDFDLWPAQDVSLSSYWLAGARIGYRILPQMEIHARVANAFDARYQDVVGYRTEGRSVLAGLRLALDR
jgi:vitamin B12 transporter